ncbi:murein transglycosylase A [Allosphingosinicella flava]|uniref:peptidoglycan lytic exotransglycosylase n=1 Tax=Allosphingosinicella flava TaxID=2771430 RepID=A0A7T2GL86_9SPHN|nr:murein transglycosylase A [Sphingosinicella flava]QPQ55921.1 murein transglycosylase A [Sphingosinicella flava]
MSIRRTRRAFLALALCLSACVPAPRPVEPAPPAQEQPPIAVPPVPTVPLAPPAAATALEAGVTLGPPLPGIAPDAAMRAWNAFQASCPALLKREDVSGLTRPEDWRDVCTPRLFESPQDIALFLRDNFTLVRVGEGTAFATGYYEPQIAGSRVRAPGYAVPIYAKPADLLAANPLTGAKGRGRLDESGAYTLYHDRAAIEDGVLAGKGLEIAWAADAVDLFFLQIQGSGQLLLPGGGVMRIGYADQNGREYVAIGKLMKDRGLLTGPVSMQAITGWLRANPEAGRALMRENKSYVFFRELTGPGPLGAMDLPVTPRVTVAADPKFVPLGAPVLLSMDDPEASGLWVAQDTGGAIKGANRFDTFWGAGPEASAKAGGLQVKGSAWILLPNVAAARLIQRQADGPQAQR